MFYVYAFMLFGNYTWLRNENEIGAHEAGYEKEWI